MTSVVAIDTSGPVTGIGTGDATSPGFSVREQGGRRHAEVIDVLMQRVIQVRHDAIPDAIPDVIAVGVGPGPYSGLRVGIAFATGLGRAWRRPVVGVCSLDAIAWMVVDEGVVEPSKEFIVATDARRDEVYWARYDSSGARIAGPQVGARTAVRFDVDVIAEREVDVAVMANRVARFLDDGCRPADVTDPWAPHGADGSQVSVPAGPLLLPRPLYLRAPDITWSARGPHGGTTQGGTPEVGSP